MRFRKLSIRVQTSDGEYGTDLDFPDGLVVVWADNSMGKSTCVKSIIAALGLEAMVSSQLSELPLPPAMLTKLESSLGEIDVLESEIFLEIENDIKERIVTQRTAKGQRDKNLITVHFGPVLSSPGTSAHTKDFFVNRGGGATRQAGFHYFLAEFLGWKLPNVQTYDGSIYPLYLQCIAPYFIVEQTRGWSTVEPPIPTQFRIREAHKRAVEFLLKLDAYNNAQKRQEIELRITRIGIAWASQYNKIKNYLDSKGVRLEALSSRPVISWPPLIQPTLMAPYEGNWVSLQDRISVRQALLKNLIHEEIPRVHEVASTVQGELNSKELLIQERQAFLSALLNEAGMEEEELGRIRTRLSAIEEDIVKNKDLRVLKQLGSNESLHIDHGYCPVCNQEVQDTLAQIDLEQSVMSLDESIEFLTEQHKTYRIVLANGETQFKNRLLQIEAVRENINELRRSVRSLRQTLISDGRQPSIAAIQEKLQLENSIEVDSSTLKMFNDMLGDFEPLSIEWKEVKEIQESLPKDDISENDLIKLKKWGEILRNQLEEYGFGSLKPSQINISRDTYRPVHEGFDLESSLHLQNSISASDLIRTIWGYLSGLLEVSRTQENNHPGTLIFDEPRQQSTRDVSFGQLLKRSSHSIHSLQQVIFFTSEDKNRLLSHLDNVSHYMQMIEGRVLKKIRSN